MSKAKNHRCRRCGRRFQTLKALDRHKIGKHGGGVVKKRTVFLVFVLLLACSCAGSSNRPSIEFNNPPEEGFSWADIQWFAGFESIRQEGYIPPTHVCGSMTQEYRDYLLLLGIPADRMRLISTTRMDPFGEQIFHLHLEVFLLGRQKWFKFDPQTGTFAGKPGPAPGWEVSFVFSGDATVVQPGGYGHLGRRFHDGIWYPR